MTQLVINNLEFCESNQLHQVKGQGGIFDFSFGSAGGFVFSPAGSAAAGSAVAVAVAIGENDPMVFTFTSS